jgi:uncharacterized membrane protein YeaQ/YmgE (transglycosylase-associated protein family)
MSLISWLLIGLCAATLARRVPFGRGYGRPGDLVAGLGGALLGGLVVARLLDRAPGFAPSGGVALVGPFVAACLLIVLLRIGVERSIRLGRLRH